MLDNLLRTQTRTVQAVKSNHFKQREKGQNEVTDDEATKMLISPFCILINC